MSDSSECACSSSKSSSSRISNSSSSVVLSVSLDNREEDEESGYDVRRKQISTSSADSDIFFSEERMDTGGRLGPGMRSSGIVSPKCRRSFESRLRRAVVGVGGWGRIEDTIEDIEVSLLGAEGGASASGLVRRTSLDRDRGSSGGASTAGATETLGVTEMVGS